MRFLPKFLQRRDATAARTQPDPADLGTAFGMEAFLEPEIPLTPNTGEGRNAQAGADENPMAWVQQRR